MSILWIIKELFKKAFPKLIRKNTIKSSQISCKLIFLNQINLNQIYLCMLVDTILISVVLNIISIKINRQHPNREQKAFIYIIKEKELISYSQILIFFQKMILLRQDESSQIITLCKDLSNTSEKSNLSLGSIFNKQIYCLMIVIYLPINTPSRNIPVSDHHPPSPYLHLYLYFGLLLNCPFSFRAISESYYNSMEEMKNVSKLIRDHKRLVLGITGKCLLKNRSKENLDFQNLLRSHSYNPKPQKETTVDPVPKRRVLSNNKMNFILSDHHPKAEKVRHEEVRPLGKTLASFHIQKREKLSLNGNENTTPQIAKSKEVFRGKAVQQLFESAVSSGVEKQVGQMLAHLQQHSILAANGKNYTIHKEHLRQIINNLLGWFGKEQLQEVKLKSNCPGLSKIITNLLVKIGKQCKEQKEKKLKLYKSTINIDIHDVSPSLPKPRLSKIARLAQQEHKLQEQVQKLVQYESSIKSECKYSQAMIEKQKRELQQLHQCAQREEQQLYRLKNQVNNAQQEYNKIMQQESRVRNFVVEQQNNKLIKEVFEEYKQIEADIYEYATYLQSNQLASDLFYEPHPFRAIEAQIDQQLKRVNMSIMQGRERSVQQKSILMRDFVLDSMGKFKRKDEEMGRVMEFRTKCILNFIEHMKKWLNNWQFKQQFLVNLRKEFAYDSTLLLEYLEKPLDEGVLGRVRELSKKIIQNYQYGNSFY